MASCSVRHWARALHRSSSGSEARLSRSDFGGRHDADRDQWVTQCLEDSLGACGWRPARVRSGDYSPRVAAR